MVLPPGDTSGRNPLHRHGMTIPGPDGPPIVPFPRKRLALSAAGGASPLEHRCTSRFPAALRPPTGVLPRKRLASSAVGGTSPLSPRGDGNKNSTASIILPPRRNPYPARRRKQVIPRNIDQNIPDAIPTPHGDGNSACSRNAFTRFVSTQSFAPSWHDDSRL